MAEPTQGEPTPWVFRHRGLLIAGSFLAAALVSFLLAPVVHLPLLEQATALDPRLRLGSRLSLDGAPVGQLLAPALLALAGMGVRAWGTSYLRGAVMMDKHLHTDRLIVAGPFRWVRNPLYLGNLLFAASLGLYLPPPGLLLAVAAMALPVGVAAAAEERALRRRFGARYEDYAAKVPAFLPRPPRRGLPAGDAVRPDWGNGLLAEAWQLLVAAYLVFLALRQPVPAAAALLLAATVIAFVRLRGRRPAGAARAPP